MTELEQILGSFRRHGWSEHEIDMIEGYQDGRVEDSPEPSANRSHCYRHGFANGRDDLRGQPRTTAAAMRVMAAKAIEADIGIVTEVRS